MMKLKKIHIWESEGFWVIDMIENDEDSEILKVCTETKPVIVFQPRYKQPMVLNDNTRIKSSEEVKTE
jgi:hypothetical protein